MQNPQKTIDRIKERTSKKKLAAAWVQKIARVQKIQGVWEKERMHPYTRQEGKTVKQMAAQLSTEDPGKWR